MPITKVSLTETDKEFLKSKQKYNSRIRIKISIVSILFLIVVYVCSGFDISSGAFSFFGVFIAIIHVFLFINSVVDTGFSHDLKEKQKYSGIVKVVKKEHWVDDENDWERFNIYFDDWKIGKKAFRKEYWQMISEGDEFYIEQAVNSEFVLRLEKENKDFKIGIQKELK